MKGTWSVDSRGLADAVEPADALLEQFGLERQVEQHEVMRELEVAPLAADLRADEEPRAVLLREPGGVAVALDQREAFVEDRHLHVEARAQWPPRSPRPWPATGR